MQNYQILVCEDEVEIGNAIEIYLKNQGYGVHRAYNGKEGLEILSRQTIHLAIVDLMMPVMDGLEATKAIRMLEREDAKKIPIIAMTANAFEEDRKACLEAGMNEHIGKPIDIPQLKRAITKLLTKRGSKRKNIIIH